MVFVKGCMPGPGRPVGSKQYKGLGIKRVIDVLREAERHPVKELIAIADRTSDLRVKRDIWMFLLPYVEAPQKEPFAIKPDVPEDSVTNAAEIAAKLKELSAPLEPKPLESTGNNGQ